LDVLSECGFIEDEFKPVSLEVSADEEEILVSENVEVVVKTVEDLAEERDFVSVVVE
jgi:hypothetical protein